MYTKIIKGKGAIKVSEKWVQVGGYDVQVGAPVEVNGPGMLGNADWNLVWQDGEFEFGYRWEPKAFYVYREIEGEGKILRFEPGYRHENQPEESDVEGCIRWAEALAAEAEPGDWE